MSVRGHSVILLALFFVAAVACAMPFIVRAQANADAVADAMCNPVETDCSCGFKMNPQDGKCDLPGNMFMCACHGPHASGICTMPNHCQATSYSAGAGQSGGSPGMSQLGQALGQLLQSLMQAAQQSSSGSGSGSGSTPATTPGTTCSSYTPTSDPTQIGVNPCVYYVPSGSTTGTCTDPTATNFNQPGACIGGSGSSSNSSAQALLNALGGSTGSPGSTAPASTGSTPGTAPVTTATPLLRATPASGAQPLSVIFTTNTIDTTQIYTVDPGDGGAQVPLSSAGCASIAAGLCVFNGTYTYQTAGTFTATLFEGNGDTLATTQVSITNPNSATGTSAAGTGLPQALQDIGSIFGQTASPAQSIAPQSSPGIPNPLGNILLDQNGATIFASAINPSNNSEVSGFYGSNTFGAQPQGVAGQLCENRPWANNFLADIIPPTFFDNLCSLGGFRVGPPPPPAPQVQPQVTLTQQTPPSQPTAAAPATKKPAATTTPPVATSTAPTVPPEAIIWAEPSSVPLGERTNVFWQSQGVSNCTESSPDGSFSENSLSGAAATVPITTATTFTISCVDPNGNPITNDITVSLSD